MQEPLGYFLTWTTYGTWLPGDERGWTNYRHGWQIPDPARKLQAEARMSQDACRLNHHQRRLVEQQIAETCTFRGWTLHAVSCRSNHVHVVVTAKESPSTVRNQLKAWCTRRLKEHQASLLILARSVSEADSFDTPRASSLRESWWAERGSQRYLNDEESLEAAILYVRDRQDKRRPG